MLLPQRFRDLRDDGLRRFLLWLQYNLDTHFGDMIDNTMSEPVLISFVDVTDAEGDKLAGSLLSSLRETDRDVSVERHKANRESQD